MTVGNVTRPRTGPGLWVGLSVVALLAFLVGLFGSALAIWMVWVLGGVAAIVGGIASSRRVRWGFALLTFGAGLLLGSAAYIGLGLIQPDGPACGGTGCTPVP